MGFLLRRNAIVVAFGVVFLLLTSILQAAESNKSMASPAATPAAVGPRPNLHLNSPSPTTSAPPTTPAPAKAEPAEPFMSGYYPAYPATAPATGEKEALIKRGEYLARMGDCIACHTDVKRRNPSLCWRAAH